MEYCSRRMCNVLVLLSAVVLMLPFIPTAASSKVEWDLFSGRDLLQDVAAQGGVYYPPKNDTKPPCKYKNANYRPKLGKGHQQFCRGRCMWNCYNGVWRCYNCRKRRSGCRNTEHSYSFTDGCGEVDYDDRNCGRMYCKGYNK